MKNNSLFLSTVIPTIGRPSLSRAVESILNQQFSAANFEVIVVNDSGQPLSGMTWQSSPHVKTIETNRHNRSVARNAGAAIAVGRYLHFLDDDDWLLPGALNHFWNLVEDSSAAWLYGGFRLVDDEGKKLVDIRPDIAGNTLIQMLSFEWIPLQASIIKSAAFFAVGGFAPLESLLGGFEDIDLSRQIALQENMASTPELVAVIRIGDRGSTTNYEDMFLQNRQSREKLLDSSNAFHRLRASVRESSDNAGYWSGRLAYYYLGSVKWNLLRKRLTKTFSRSFFFLSCLVIAGRHLYSGGFWRALTQPHYNQVLLAREQVGATHIYDGVNWK